MCKVSLFSCFNLRKQPFLPDFRHFRLGIAPFFRSVIHFLYFDIVYIAQYFSKKHLSTARGHPLRMELCRGGVPPPAGRETHPLRDVV